MDISGKYFYCDGLKRDYTQKNIFVTKEVYAKGNGYYLKLIDEESDIWLGAIEGGDSEFGGNFGSSYYMQAYHRIIFPKNEEYEELVKEIESQAMSAQKTLKALQDRVKKEDRVEGKTSFYRTQEC